MMRYKRFPLKDLHELTSIRFTLHQISETQPMLWIVRITTVLTKRGLESGSVGIQSGPTSRDLSEIANIKELLAYFSPMVVMLIRGMESWSIYMSWITESVGILSLIQGLGLLGLIASRLGERCRYCQSVFFFAMLVVATATLCSVRAGSGTWAVSGTTLSLMVVGATLDCGRLQRVRSCQ